MNKQNIIPKVFCLVVFYFLSIHLRAQENIKTVQQIVTGWQTNTDLKNASICMAVSDNQSSEILIKSEPQQSLVPASILKLVTTATALEVFGPEYQFSTVLSYSGDIRNDTLFGDLQIIGGGDPTLGSKYFLENNHFLDDWIKALQNRNIKFVQGNIIVDASIYESQMIPNTWIWEDIGNYYGAGASGLSVYDNLYEIHLSSAKEAGVLTKMERIDPEIPGLELQNQVVSSEQNSDQAYVFGSPMDNKRIIQGTIPINKNDFVVKASIPDPVALIASQFRETLETNGIAISGETKFEKAKIGVDESHQLNANQSPTLREIIRITNHESVNLFAEHLLKHLAFVHSGLGTTKDGCKFVVDFWKSKGIDLSGFFMNDGSGLSRFNAVTASQMVNILNYMKNKSAYSADFYQSLATSGNGTLTVFRTENFPNQCLRAKSGSMTRVRCYAGYLTTDNGRQLTYAIMLNNFACSQTEAIKKIEKVLVELRKL